MLNGKTVTPLYVQLMNQIEEKIRCGVYQPGERLQSESEMAKLWSQHYHRKEALSAA